VGANAEYVRGFVEAWNRRDLQGYLDDMEPEFEWVPAREHPGSKNNRGPEETAAYLSDWLSTMPDLQIEAEELVEQGDRVLLVLRMSGTGSGSGALTEVRMATITTFRDGKSLRTEEFLDPDDARRALAAD
jgi:ketosteroid isomerase-like protein